MTAPRRIRPARPVPPGRETPRSAERIPSAALRRARGPRPPDDVIEALERALQQELQGLWHADATIDPAGIVRLGARWAAAIAKAAAGIATRARRGVLRALESSGGRHAVFAAAENAPVATPLAWAAATTAAVEASATAAIRAGRAPAVVLERASGVAASAVLQEHARQIQARAVAAGSHGYVWTTQRDEKVRHGHALLEGTRQRWDAPPVTDPQTGYRAHPGEPRNCRCMPWPLVRIRTAPTRG